MENTLYLCHFLSTWDARMYEFAAVLFTAAAFSDSDHSLIASSIFGLTMSLSVFCFASLLGTWIDQAPSRLRTLLVTVFANRIAVVGACGCWLFVVERGEKGTEVVEGRDGMAAVMDDGSEGEVSVSVGLKVTMFAVILVFSVIERLSRTANVLCIERDWVPTIALEVSSTSPQHTSQSPVKLAYLNAVMSRIDLICKFFAPIAISLFISAVQSSKLGAVLVGCQSLITWAVEVWSATHVWKNTAQLREPKQILSGESSFTRVYHIDVQSKAARDNCGSGIRRFLQLALQGIRIAIDGIQSWATNYMVNINIYFSSQVWVPSMALSILHFSVLNFSATLTVYLLNSGISLNYITIAKALSASSELSSTFSTPLLIQWFGKGDGKINRPSLPHEESVTLLDDQEDPIEEDHEAELENDSADLALRINTSAAHLGLWALLEMFLSLLLSLLAISPLSTSQSTVATPLTIAILLIAIPSSRWGRWTNHLTTQQLTQESVPRDKRSAFAGAEMGLVSLFGMAHWVITAIWSRREEFVWLAVGSVASVAVSLVGSWVWVRRLR